MRVIDADALLDKVQDYGEGQERLMLIDPYWVRKAPTVERPHGEWEHWGSPFSDDSIANSIVCSLCKARYVEIEDEVFNFCPNCGADMRKEGDMV